jgi:anti-sigma regulatory factor (Ser/Thr protein kinase)
MGIADQVPGHVLQDLRLLASELVANSVRHAGLEPGEPIDVAVVLAARRVRLEVSDAGPGFTPRPAGPPPAHVPGGRGLYMVDRLSDRWGVRTNSGTCVWLELAWPDDAGNGARGD